MNGKKIIELIILIILILSLGLNLILSYDSDELQNQIYQRDLLIKERQTADSLLSLQNENNERIVKKYIDDCGILINNKKVSTNDLLKFINETMDLNDQLIDSLNSIQDSLSIYRAFKELAKKNLDIDFKVNQDSLKRYVTIELPFDSLSVYKDIINLVELNYGIKYYVTSKESTYSFSKDFSKVDSALMIFDHYRHKLKSNGDGTWTVSLPIESVDDNIEKKKKKK